MDKINKQLLEIINSEVSHYKTDLEKDLKDIREDFKLRGVKSETYIWFTRENGTVLMRESFITVLNSNENVNFKYWENSAVNCYRIVATKACPINIYGKIEKIDLNKYKTMVFSKEKKYSRAIIKIETKLGKTIEGKYPYTENCYRDTLSIEKISTDDIISFNYLNYMI